MIIDTRSPHALIRFLLTRYGIPFENGESFDNTAIGLGVHLDTLEADAREAHSAARVLGCTVADLADRAKEQHCILTETAKTMGVSIAGVLNMVTALRRSETVLVDQLKHRHVILTKCLHLLGQPNADSYDVVPDLIEGLLAKLPSATAQDAVWPDAMTRFLREIHNLLPDLHLEIDAELTPENILKRLRWLAGLELSQKEAAQHLHRLLLDCAAAMGLGSTTVLEQIPAAVKNRYEDYQRAHRERDEAQITPMATTLQAITEALPSDLRYTEDIAGAVRQVVLTSQTNYGLYQQVQEEVAPHKQIVGILRELLEVSRPLCLAMVRELWSDDEALQDLLTTVSAERLAATLMESLAAPHDPLIPATTPPTPQAKALEGLCSVAFYRHPMTPGRLEAIGGALLRFRPLRGGGEVIVNCDRRDLEVYPLDPSDLEAKFSDPITPKPSDDDIPW